MYEIIVALWLPTVFLLKLLAVWLGLGVLTAFLYIGWSRVVERED